jgi:Putative RRM domain
MADTMLPRTLIVGSPFLRGWLPPSSNANPAQCFPNLHEFGRNLRVTVCDEPGRGHDDPVGF